MILFGVGLSLIFGLVLFLLAGWLMLLGIAWLIRQLLGRGPSDRVDTGGRVPLRASSTVAVASPGRGAWHSLFWLLGLFVFGVLVFGSLAFSTRTTAETRVKSGDEEISMISSVTGPGGIVIQKYVESPDTTEPRQSQVRVDEGRVIVSSEEDAASVTGNTEGLGPASETKVVIPKTPEERRRLLAEFAGQVERLFGGGIERSESDRLPPALGESRNGEVVILELTQPMVRRLLGDSAGDILRDMQSRLPEDIREGYALIPLGRSLGSAIPPVPPRLAASGLSSLADALVSILGGNTKDKSAAVMGGDAEGASAMVGSGEPSSVGSERPAWLSDPGVGGRVVRLTRLGMPEQLERERGELLNEAARELLLERAEAEGVSGDYFAALRVVDFSAVERFPRDSSKDSEGKSWVVGPYTEQVEADLGGSSGPMLVTVDYYLVKVPEAISVAALPEVVSRVQRVRMAGLFSCGASLWLGMVLLSATGRTAAGGRGWRWLVMPGRIGAGVFVLGAVILGVSLFSGNLSSRAAAEFVFLED